MQTLQEHGIKVGDIVTTYQKGFFRITKIEQRFNEDDESQYEINPLYYYVQVMNTNFKKTRGKRVRCCDSVFCHKVDEKKDC